MRKSKAQAAETRRRIVEVASDEFRRKGIAGAGLVDLMAAAGLTAGGFYRHFDSKDRLVAEAVAAACTATTDLLVPKGDDGDRHDRLTRTLDIYLSTNHRDKPEAGCPLAALGSELARSDRPIRDAASDGFRRLVDIVAASYPRPNSAAARKRAMVAVATMIGALTMSRVLNDRDDSAALLEAARAAILRG
jgi:TetR/AcrR family transcriptional repressor of nem operon